MGNVSKTIITFGKFKGETVGDMSTTYLLWMASQDHIRYKRPEVMRCVLGVLRARFNEFDTLLDELAQDSPPPEYWKEKRKQASGSKAGRQLSARHHGEGKEIRSESLPADQIIDGYYFVRNGQRNTDVSDLV